MKLLYSGVLKRSLWPWIAIFVAALISIAGLSFSYEVYRARAMVAQYFSIWEEDLAQSLLVKKDSSLLDKILGQLREVHSAVASVQVNTQEQKVCAFSNDIPITLFSLPAGQVRVCYSSADLIWKSLLSPIFMLGLFLGLLFLFFGSRRELLTRLKEQRLEAELSLNKEISAISRQVAHDIRGPLMALSTLSQLSHEMTEEKKELLVLAVSRIRGIADDLLSKGKNLKVEATGSHHEVPSRSVEVSPQVSDLSLVCEKILKEYRFSHSSIHFVLHRHIKTNEALVSLSELKLQRVLANILNNSIEAAPEKEAQIDISILERDDCWLLQVMDNGVGIPEDVLPRLMAEGASYGKENGNGLGLFDAKKALQLIGGDLQIRSRVAVGTQVLLIFPKSACHLLVSNVR